MCVCVCVCHCVCAGKEWLWVSEICNCMHACVLCDEYCEIHWIYVAFSVLSDDCVCVCVHK